MIHSEYLSANNPQELNDLIETFVQQQQMKFSLFVIDIAYSEDLTLCIIIYDVKNKEHTKK